jgi:hypothetical protein
MPKIIVLGYARHGKDTVCDYLRDLYGLEFQSSSLICAKEIVKPYLETKGIYYDDIKSCFEDRAHHRKEWFDAICAFNKDDRTKLGTLIFKKHDVYCGLRNKEELEAMKKQKLYDLCIWVDSSGRGVAIEPESSCTVCPEDADVILKNNRTLDELRLQIMDVMNRFFPDMPALNK